MIVLFTDFGVTGPYVGQIRNVLQQHASREPVVELFSDAPRHNPLASAYLLAAYVHEFPQGTIFLCVVDPGVGSVSRKPVVVNVDGYWFVGPDNGLFDVVVKRASKPVECWDITWLPEKLSSTFHGRDLFAPVAAKLVHQQAPPGEVREYDLIRVSYVTDDLLQVIYIDAFGNCMIGLRAEAVSPSSIVEIGNLQLSNARTYSDVKFGQGFWYINANNLVEIAVNQGNAANTYALDIGSSINIL